MFVLGIDPGLTTTGYGLVADGPRAVVAGVIRTSAQAPVAERLLELHRDLTGLVAEHRPEVVAIEQVFSNRNLQTVANVGRAAGVAMLVAAQAGLLVYEYTPSSVKRAVAGYGNAPKEQVQKMVAQRLRLAELPRPADAADALAVALCHLQGAALLERVEAAR
jgi:crossover junction endodeoxyribonuclease RuvC